MSRCAMCAAPADIPAGDVVSANFTDADLWRCRDDSPAPLLCCRCAGRYRDTDLRRYPHTVTADEHVRMSLPETTVLLSAPLPADVAVVVPVGGRKHLWHHCRGGHVTSDQVPAYRWDEQCAARLGAVAELRALGFGESAIAETAPRWAVMGRLSPDEQTEALRLWPLLDEWRTIWRPLLDVAVRATRTPKETAA